MCCPGVAQVLFMFMCCSSVAQLLPRCWSHLYEFSACALPCMETHEQTHEQAALPTPPPHTTTHRQEEARGNALRSMRCSVHHARPLTVAFKCLNRLVGHPLAVDGDSGQSHTLVLEQHLVADADVLAVGVKHDGQTKDEAILCGTTRYLHCDGNDAAQAPYRHVHVFHHTLVLLLVHESSEG